MLFFEVIIMAINIPNRNTKILSQLIDGLRIIAWQEYKNENRDSEVKGLDLYELFKEEWVNHEIHKMSLAELNKFMAELRYTQADLAGVRSEYYRNRNQNNNNQNQQPIEALGNIPF